MSSLCEIVILLTYLTLAVCNGVDLSSEHVVSTQLPKPIKLWHNYDEDITYIARDERSHRPTLIDIALQASVREGLDAMTELYATIEPNIIKNGQILNDSHPAALLSKFSAPQVDSEAKEMAAYATISATKAFRKNYKYFNDLARQAHNQKISLRRTALEGLCPPRDAPICMPASERYRTHDGTCNNKKRLRWGSAQMPFNRFLPPEYGDGVDAIRNSVEGGPLSSSRFVSLLVHGARDGEAPLTLMIVQWGQLLDHDMTSTAQPRSINGSVPSCCGSQDTHPSCYPIKVPLDDPWLAPLKVRCLEFLRSAPAQRRDCVLSWREQTNQATSFIDASPIYSNSAKASDNARTFHKGLLIFGRGNVNKADDVCQRGAIERKCIRSGDGRSGEQPGLLALHHVWVGEHNRIATELSEMNGHWSDEKLYQETRRIVGAMFQHITFREFLPIVLGREVVKLFDLELLNSGYFNGYNPKVNPTIANAFAAAAFRFGHSLVQNSYIRCDRHHNVINNNVSLHEEFQHGDIGTAGSLHRLLRGMAMQRALRRDEFITPELTNHLFQTPGFPFGLDLAAINIQRGRDHGIAPYTAWRLPCGLTPINTWDDFANVVGPESARRIGHAYRSVHDIDLFVGGIAERPVVGGLVGPTFACIIAQQFSNSRKGDRFWYENGGFESSFTPAQLHSIRRVSLAQVLCRTLGGGTFQPHIFIPPDFPGNERQQCGVDALAPIDLSPWLEQDQSDVIRQRPAFETQEPDKIFDIITETTITRPTAQLHTDDNPPTPNRIKDVKTTTKPLRHKPHIDFIPNGSIGFQRPKNPTRINDKLDLKRKGTTTKRPTTQSSVTGVNNKLDKRQKITLNLKGGTNRRKVQTTKRTVIINNVPIELRHAADANGPFSNSTDITVETTDEVEPRIEHEETEHLDSSTLKVFEMTSVPLDTTARPMTVTDHTLLSTVTEKIVTDDDETPTDTDTLSKLKTIDAKDNIDPLTHSTAPNHKRVQRKLNTTSHSPLMKSNLSKVFSNDMPLSHNTSTKFLLTNLKYRTSTTTTATPIKETKPTKRNIELRQYQNGPIYTRPQKVVVNGPNADQYEIEINIRQTNKSPAENALTTYDDYTTAHRPFNYDRYTYPQHSSTTPIYGYYQHPPNTLAINVHAPYTKPPTIIYVDEDERTTTKAPGLLQNFLSFATNGFSNNHKPNENKHKPESTSSNIFSSPHPPYQVQFPIGTSGVGQVGNSGLSAAISGNGFSAIAGVASANGGDSIFSFNIRPKPSVSQTSIISKPSGSNSFGFYTPPQNPIYSHSPAPDYSNPSIAHFEQQNNLQNSHSPFSSSLYHPQPSHTYYNRLNRPQLKHVNDHKVATLDYDYLSRTLETATESNSEQNDSDEYLYDYDNDSLTISTVKKFDRDGYLRPEHMGLQLFKAALTRTTNKTKLRANTTLNDNYVMPMLNDTTKHDPQTMILTTNCTDNDRLTDKSMTVPRHFINDISAEETTPMSLNDKLNLKNSQKVAFAPLTLLTNVERPDNWVIFNEPIEKQLLPEIPDMQFGASGDTFPASEIPKPIKNLTMLWLKKYLTIETDHTTTEPPAVPHNNDGQDEKVTTMKNIATEIVTSALTNEPNEDATDSLQTTTVNTDLKLEKLP